MDGAAFILSVFCFLTAAVVWADNLPYLPWLISGILLLVISIVMYLKVER